MQWAVPLATPSLSLCLLCFLSLSGKAQSKHIRVNIKVGRSVNTMCSGYIGCREGGREGERMEHYKLID